MSRWDSSRVSGRWYNWTRCRWGIWVWRWQTGQQRTLRVIQYRVRYVGAMQVGQQDPSQVEPQQVGQQGKVPCERQANLQVGQQVLSQVGPMQMDSRTTFYR